MIYYIGGVVGYGVLGRGLNKIDFFLEYEVLFVVGIFDGIVVSYKWDFGDGMFFVKMKNVRVLYCFFDV